MEERCFLSKFTTEDQGTDPSAPSAGRVTWYTKSQLPFVRDASGTITLLGSGAHAATHENGGSDEIEVENLATSAVSTSFVLKPDGAGGVTFGSLPTHVASHENGGGDEISVAGLSGLLADGQTPTSHASTHSDGGSDEITVESLATSSNDTSTALRPDGAGGLAFSDVAHSDLTGIGIDDHHARDHASAHSDGGADEVTVENLATGSVNTALVLKPDGVGGLVFGSVAGGTDELAKVSANDTTAGFLNGKLTAGTGITLTENNDGANEDLEIIGHAEDHASRHENGGGDEISVAGLSGLLGDAQTPTAHASTHSDGGSDEITVESLAATSTDTSTALRPDGAGGLTFSDVAHSDLTGIGIDDHHARDHASTHSDGGADEITVESLATASSTTTNVLKPDGSGGLVFTDLIPADLPADNATLPSGTLASTASATFVDGFAGGSISPPEDGDYFIIFESEVTGTGGGTRIGISIGLNSTVAEAVAGTERIVEPDGGSDPIHNGTTLVLTGLLTTDTIHGIFRHPSGGGSAQLLNRRITMIAVH